MKTSELAGVALDWAVAKCEGLNATLRNNGSGFIVIAEAHCFSTDWSQAGPIIEREGISLLFCLGDLGEPSSYWSASSEACGWCYNYGPYHEQEEERSAQIYKSETHIGTTPLIAAMRCYVASTLGDEVEIPQELES